MERSVVDGHVEAVERFNTEQRLDEIAQRDLLVDDPEIEHELFHLELHPILRGCLMAFEYDAAALARRAQAFRAVFSEPTIMGALTGALLAVGDYSRELNAATHRFGPPTQPSNWRELLAAAARREPGSPTPAQSSASCSVASTRLARRSASNWPRSKKTGSPSGKPNSASTGATTSSSTRPCARARRGIYVGFSLCMLEGTALNGCYRDPFLLAVASESGTQASVVGSIQHWPDGPWFTGPASTPRRMRLVVSGVGVRCVAGGFAMQPPAELEHHAPFDGVRAEHGLVETDDAHVLHVPHELADGSQFDMSDRVQLGAALLADLVAAGL